MGTTLDSSAGNEVMENVARLDIFYLMEIRLKSEAVVEKCSSQEMFLKLYKIFLKSW